VRSDVRLPFLQALAPAQLGTWRLRVGDEEIELPEEHPAWDPTVDIDVSRNVVLDTETLRAECGLGNHASVRLVAGWQCESARAKQFPWRCDLRAPARFEGLVSVHVPGSMIASSVELIVGVVLVSPGQQASTLAAQTLGSWLWRDSQELRLESSRGRFPMEWTDFKRSGLSPNAPWFLDWPSQDWDRPLLGSVRLRLNATNPLMEGLLDLPEDDERRSLVVRAAMLDVAKQLVIAALDSDEFVDNCGHYGEGTVGMAVSILIGMAFPGMSLKAVRSLLRDHAGEFHMMLQAAVVPFTKAS